MTRENFKISASHLPWLLKFIYDWPMVKQQNHVSYCAANAKVLLMLIGDLIFLRVQPIATSEHQSRIQREERIEMTGRGRKIIIHSELRLYKEFSDRIFSPKE